MSRIEAQTLRHPATCLVLRAETLTGISPTPKLVASDSKRIQTIAHGISNGQFENSDTALDLICSKYIKIAIQKEFKLLPKASVPLLSSEQIKISLCSKCNKLTNQLLWDGIPWWQFDQKLVEHPLPSNAKEVLAIWFSECTLHDQTQVFHLESRISTVATVIV